MRILFWIATVWLAGPGFGATAADADWGKLQEVLTTPSGGGLRAGRVAAEAWAARQDEISRRAFDFFTRHRDDPRHWEAVLVMLMFPRPFVVRVEDDIDQRGIEALVIDEMAAREWRAKLFALVDELLGSPTATPDEKERAEMARFGLGFSESTRTLIRGGAVDLAALRATLDEFQRRFPANRRVNEMDGAFWNVVCLADPFQVEPWLKQAVELADSKIAARARRRLETLQAAAAPVQLRFTALDGRPVDTAGWRGKVVLVDFWATWCRPCLAELPNVRAVYERYHALGFEVIGIALENPGMKPDDTAEQRTSKIETARTKLTEFVAKEAIPWPQQFDGKFWQNDFARRFGIVGLPAMLLLDRNGMIVSMNARGARLESEVKRLLEL